MIASEVDILHFLDKSQPIVESPHNGVRIHGDLLFFLKMEKLIDYSIMLLNSCFGPLLILDRKGAHHFI